MNIREYLFKTLNNKELLNLLADNKVYFLHADCPNVPYVEYEVLSTSGANYAEGQEEYTNYIIQVDIFSTSSYAKIEKTVLKIMEEANFNRNNARDLFEKKTGLYHKAMRFNISLPREE